MRRLLSISLCIRAHLDFQLFSRKGFFDLNYIELSRWTTRRGRIPLTDTIFWKLYFSNFTKISQKYNTPALETKAHQIGRLCLSYSLLRRIVQGSVMRLVYGRSRRLYLVFKLLHWHRRPYYCKRLRYIPASYLLLLQHSCTFCNRMGTIYLTIYPPPQTHTFNHLDSFIKKLNTFGLQHEHVPSARATAFLNF